jgi:hypothetical protein
VSPLGRLRRTQVQNRHLGTGRNVAVVNPGNNEVGPQGAHAGVPVPQNPRGRRKAPYKAKMAFDQAGIAATYKLYLEAVELSRRLVRSTSRRTRRVFSPRIFRMSASE